MAKDVNIHVKAKGTQQTKQQLDGVGKSTEGVGDKAKKGADGVDKLSGSASKAHGLFSRFTSGLIGWATKLIGITAIIAGITKAINIQKQALEEHARIAEEQQKKLLSLQYLGEFFKERPQLRKEVAAYAEFGRRPFTEVAEAWYNLRSKAARLSPQQRGAIMREALELGRTQPEAPLQTIVDMFSLYAKQTGAADINRVQNIIQQTITEAGGGAADVAKYMPMFLPVGMAGGLTGPQAAGLWSYVTTQMAEPSMATTGLRAVFMALQGRGTPESQKMLQQLGITPQMGFFQKIQALSAQQRAGGFGLGRAELLAGREGAPVLLSMLARPGEMMETISNVVGAGRGRRDITRDMITQLMSADEVARLEEESRRLDITLENIKGRDVRAQRWTVYLKDYENRLREAGLSEYRIAYSLWWARQFAGFGAEPGTGEFFYRPEGVAESPNEIHIHNDTIYNPTVGSKERMGGPRTTSEIR